MNVAVYIYVHLLFLFIYFNYKIFDIFFIFENLIALTYFQTNLINLFIWTHFKVKAQVDIYTEETLYTVYTEETFFIHITCATGLTVCFLFYMI